MSIKLAMSTAAFGLIVLVSTPVHAQRNVLEGIIGGVIDNAINNNSRRQQPQLTPGAPKVKYNNAMPAESGRSPNESGPGYQNNPFGGQMGDLIRQQQQQQAWQRQQQQQQLQQQRLRQQWQPQQQQQQWQQPQGQTVPSNSQYQRVYNSQTGQYEYHQVTQGAPARQQGTVIREGTVIHQGTPVTTTAKPTPTVIPSTVNSLPINITLPKTQSESCPFTLISGTSEFPRRLNPGQRQPLKGSSVTWYVQFKGNGGTKKYRLRPGSDYLFQRDGQGFWELYKQPEVVVEDPPELPQP